MNGYNINQTTTKRSQWYIQPNETNTQITLIKNKHNDQKSNWYK